MERSRGDEDDAWGNTAKPLKRLLCCHGDSNANDVIRSPPHPNPLTTPTPLLPLNTHPRYDGVREES